MINALGEPLFRIAAASPDGYSLAWDPGSQELAGRAPPGRSAGFSGKAMRTIMTSVGDA